MKRILAVCALSFAAVVFVAPELIKAVSQRIYKPLTENPTWHPFYPGGDAGPSLMLLFPVCLAAFLLASPCFAHEIRRRYFPLTHWLTAQRYTAAYLAGALAGHFLLLPVVIRRYPFPQPIAARDAAGVVFPLHALTVLTSATLALAAYAAARKYSFLRSNSLPFTRQITFFSNQ